MAAERINSSKAIRDKRREETDRAASQMINADLQSKGDKTDRLRKERLSAALESGKRLDQKE